MLPLAVADRALLITNDAPSPALPDCLREAYHGDYGGRHVYMPSADKCADSSFTTGFFGEGSIARLEDGEHLVWVTGAGIEGWKGGREGLMAAWEAIESASALLVGAAGAATNIGEQATFSAEQEITIDAVPQLLGASDTGLFMVVSSRVLPVIDTLLPREVVTVGVSPTPLGYGIPEHYAKNLANITKHLKSNNALHNAVSTLNATSIRDTVRYLTGEDKSSGITSRHSFTPGARIAADWLKKETEKTGAKCELFYYLDGFSPDVICKYHPTTNSTDNVILSGHYDSRGSFGSLRAPGADDDGSGSAHVLAIARAIHEHDIRFKHPVTLAFFSGEEQGLYGSHYYAKHLSEKNASVALHIQADMLAYRVPGEPMQLGLPETIELPEAGWLVANVSAIYSPDLVVGRTAACCSDHQSFLSFGYPATQVFERNDWIADPMYHNSGDLSEREGYDFEQIAAIARVTMASVCEVAGWVTN